MRNAVLMDQLLVETAVELPRTAVYRFYASNGVVDFARVARLEPRVAELLTTVLRMDRNRCPDCEWPAIKRQIMDIVGLHAETVADPWLGSAEAFEATVTTLYEAMPLVACDPCGAD